MASTRYIGYVGGMAVAMGVGAAIAVAGQGTAHADSASTDNTKSDSKAETTSGPTGAATSPDGSDAGSAKTTSEGKRPKPLSKIGSRMEKAGDRIESRIDDRIDKVKNRVQEAGGRLEQATSEVTRTVTIRRPEAKPAADEPEAGELPKPTAEEFEADQVDKLKSILAPKDAATGDAEDATGDTDDESTEVPLAASAVVTQDIDPSTGVIPNDTPTPWDQNPFRAEDPAPYSMPDELLDLELAILGAPFLPQEVRPVVREGYELAYRVSQVVPWVNVVIPVSEIVPAVLAALTGEEEARDAAQLVINELLLTTQPVSFLYYGWDQVADLVNMEYEGQQFKEEFFITAWNVLDPFQLLHNAGQSGLGQSAGQ